MSIARLSGKVIDVCLLYAACCYGPFIYSVGQSPREEVLLHGKSLPSAYAESSEMLSGIRYTPMPAPELLSKLVAGTGINPHLVTCILQLPQGDVHRVVQGLATM